MAQYKTPGVYVEEKSTLSPSVAGVETAIPAFIGVTEKGFSSSDKLEPVAISSLLDYQNVFGKGPALTVDEDKHVSGQQYALFDSMRLFYDNGGADCYVISIGDYNSTPTADLYKDAIDKLDERPDVTILLFPDAAMLLKQEELQEVQQYALNNCERLKSRFAILDLKRLDDLTKAMQEFRDGVSCAPEVLSYGAAYYPYLKTSYVKDIPFEEVMKAIEQPTDPEELKVWQEAMALITPAEEVVEPLEPEEPADPNEEDPQPVIPVLNSQHMLPEDDTPASDADEDENADADEDAETVEEPKKEAAPERDYEKELKITSIIPRVPGYAKTLAALQEEACIIPPSGAMAGIFAATDRRVGVWQAPANVGVASIKGLSQLLTDNQQDKMNVDPSTSKSINAIRYFKGKGYLVWGSRTLNAGSNEWRYVPVRRLFNYVEQSVKLSTYWAVFQPNDSNTWTKIKCQISNFLNTLWRDGALAGATPEEAYFVEVGKDITMTPEDIYNGYLIVRIGLAAVRPAEFIVLEFSHKVQE